MLSAFSKYTRKLVIVAHAASVGTVTVPLNCVQAVLDTAVCAMKRKEDGPPWQSARPERRPALVDAALVRMKPLTV